MKKVLVVDDEKFCRIFFRQLIEKHTSMSVIEATDGFEALELMRQEKVDVIILDVNMPKLDGYGTVGRMKQNPALVNIPIIIITQLDPDAYLKSFQDQKVNGFFSKLDIVDNRNHHSQQEFLEILKKTSEI